MTTIKSALIVCASVCLAIAINGPGSTWASDDLASLIRANALMDAAYKRDPATGRRLAEEVRVLLAAARAGDSGAEDRIGPRIRRRGGDGAGPGPSQSEMERQHRKVFEGNPALRKMFLHSPVAYLRMLKRLRAAAGTGQAAAAQ